MNTQSQKSAIKNYDKNSEISSNIKYLKYDVVKFYNWEDSYIGGKMNLNLYYLDYFRLYRVILINIIFP